MQLRSTNKESPAHDIPTAVLALTVAARHSLKNPMVGGAAMYENKNIVENAVNSADHTTLVAAVKAAGLVDTLSGAGPSHCFCADERSFRRAAGCAGRGTRREAAS